MTVGQCQNAEQNANETCGPKRDSRFHAVVDAGFVEGGFCYSIVREAHAKNLEPRPLLPKTTPIFERF